MAPASTLVPAAVAISRSGTLGGPARRHSLADHPTPDRRKQQEGDPVVERGDDVAEGAPRAPAGDQRSDLEGGEQGAGV